MPSRKGARRGSRSRRSRDPPATRRAAPSTPQAPSCGRRRRWGPTARSTRSSTRASPAASPAIQACWPFCPTSSRQLRDERAAQIVAGNLIGSVPSGPGYLDWLDAQGFPASTFDFAVDITDEGVDKGVLPPPAGSHPDFYQNGDTANPTPDRLRSTRPPRDADARDCGGHGTNVASIATGYNDQTGHVEHDGRS